MRRSDFRFDLPGELIAQYPLPERGASRLLVVDGAAGEMYDRAFADIRSLIGPGDLLVFNNTRVIPARLLGRKPSGGSVEVLIERIVETDRALAHIKASRAPRPGTILCFDTGRAEVTGRAGGFFELAFDRELLPLLDEIGHVPLPPYVRRADEDIDRERYQTVYATEPGAVAAPTAGLHFDESMIETLRNDGVNTVFVTLHVGAGTFQPVRVEDPRQHRMHPEYAEVSEEVCTAVERTKADGGRVIAVGTTSVRSLESAAVSRRLEPFNAETDLFIRPGYRFRIVDAMITNFHLPESTLLMLVCAFAGYDHVMGAYRHAVSHRYRFFSYGDAMFLTPCPDALA